MLTKYLACFSLACLIIGSCYSQKITIDRNKPERKEWFSNLGLGLHLDLSLYSQFGNQAAERLNGSSRDYQDWYFNELPKIYNPKDFDPDQLAALVKLAGIEYIMITAKRFDGFCFWETKTTDFTIMNSRFGKDMLMEAIESFRKQGIAIGLYFTPDDFHFMYNQGYQLSRESPGSSSTTNTSLWEFNKQQINELLTNYGPIDLLYIEERSDWANILVANHVWNMKPELFITGGAMMISENYVPQKDFPDEWLGYFTITTSNRWDSEIKLRDAREIIRLLIETRSKGGDFILSVSPNSNGIIPDNQDAILREVALWHRINRLAIGPVKPWSIQYENGCRFTATDDGKTVYAFLDEPGWNTMDGKAFFFSSMAANKESRVSVLGIADNAIEYPANKSLTPIVSSTADGLFFSILKPQSFRPDANLPVVIKIENVSYCDSKAYKK
jgi:alpha-L-fucosidase